MLTDYVALRVLIDWDNDGDFLDPEEDVSAYVRYPVKVSRGRASVNDAFSAGTGSFSLRNVDGRFTPLNPSSPLYPKVLPGRPVRITATYRGVTYDVFAGRCTPERQRSGLGDAEIEMSMVDAFEELRLGRTRTPLLQGKRVDEVIAAILDDIGWPADLRRLDVGPDILTVFTNHNRLPLNALQLAAAQDPGGAVFIGRDGAMVYQNRYHRSIKPIHATLPGTVDDIEPQIRQEDMVDRVVATYPRFAVSPTLEPVWSLQLPRRLPPGDTVFEFEVNASGVLGAEGYVSPVPGTDYAGNTQSDGSGDDKTDMVTIAILSSSSGGGTLQATNLDMVDVWLLAGAQVRAYPLREGGDKNTVEASVPSPVITGQTLRREFEFLDNAITVQGWVHWQVSMRGDVRVRPIVTIVPDTDALMGAVLGAEIGDRVVLTDTAAPWTTQISDVFVIEGIEIEFESPTLVRARWHLFDSGLAQANMFRVSGAEGSGQDYSTIAAPDGRGDRIGY